MISYPIKVLIVEDSPLAAKILSSIVDSDSKLQVIGCVSSGEEALKFIEMIKPDVILMDIILPHMDGFEATHQIMQTMPIPIIIISSTFQKEDIEKSFKAISVGALEILEKPSGPQNPLFESQKEELIHAIKNAALIKLTTRRSFSSRSQLTPKEVIINDISIFDRIKAIGIGASLGGPTAFSTLFSEIPAHFPLPFLIVQHISEGFTKGFVEWLQNTTQLKIKIAEDQEALQPGCVYIAPEGLHLEVSLDQTVYLSQDPKEEGLRPSINHLFYSLAEVYGSKAMGILLTGMGHDGVKGLHSMRQKGAVTIAQDESSSLIFGMPKEAMIQGAAQYVLSLQQIITLIKSFL